MIKGVIDENTRIFYNNNVRKWQLTFNADDKDSIHWWSYDATNLDEMIENSERFVTADEWVEDVSPNGITFYTPINPTITLN